MSIKAIILDANILIRAVLGKRVRELIVENAAAVNSLRLMWRTPMPGSTFLRCWKNAASKAQPP